MPKQLTIILLIVFFAIPSIASGQGAGLTVPDSSVISVPAGNASLLAGSRISGYAGVAWSTFGPMLNGGIRYSLKNNQYLQFNLSSTTFNPMAGWNDFAVTRTPFRLIQPSVLYQYYFIGGDNQGHISYHGLRTETQDLPKFSLYGFGGIGADIITYGVSSGNVNQYGSSTRMVIPLGLGMTYKFNEHTSIGIQIQGRFSTSGGMYNPFNQGYPGYFGGGRFQPMGNGGFMNGPFRNGAGF